MAVFLFLRLRMKKILFTLLIVASLPGFSQTRDVQYFYTQAKEAYKAKDFPNFYNSIAAAYQLHPYHQVILYNHGIASALAGKPDEAVTFLKKAILINADFDLNNPDLGGLKNRPDFLALVKLQDELKTPIVHGKRAFVITDRQLHTEGITFDRTTQSFFVGSIHKRKVVRIASNGSTTDFLAQQQDGLTSVMGIKADADRQILWVASSPMPEMENYDSTLSSTVRKFDLKSGKLLATYKLQEAPRSVLGDLTLDKNGRAFVSDSQNNIIFQVNEGSQSLEKFYDSKDFWNIQGICFSDDGKSLFIADYVKGVLRLDLATKVLHQVDCSLDVSLKGIDGLSLYKNSLIAVQNGVNPLRVMRYYLDKEAEKIVRSEVLDWKHHDFNEPTMGTVVGDAFYYIANSQWGGYENGKIKPNDQLQDIVILTTPLK